MMTFRSIATAFVVIAGFIAVAQAQPTLADRKAKIESMDTRVSAEARDRKARSEAILKAEGVRINASLPVIETDVVPRAKDEIAYRAMALLVVAVKGEGMEQDAVDRIIEEYGLASHFTPKERAFLANSSPSAQDKVQFVWRYESAWVLLWALGYVDTLEKPSTICDVPKAVGFMRDRSPRTFIADAKLRSMSEILDHADRIYRYHWPIVDARVNGSPAPSGIEPDVVMERHHALNWLIRYMDQAWDDVTTDT